MCRCGFRASGNIFRSVFCKILDSFELAASDPTLASQNIGNKPLRGKILKTKDLVNENVA